MPPVMGCAEISFAVLNANQLHKKGMGREEIYWEITPMHATYVQQYIYLSLIDLGIKSTEKESLGYVETCVTNIEAHQKAFNDLSTALFDYVDLIYTTVYNTERDRYTSYKGLVAGWSYGASKNDMYNKFVTKTPPHGIDPLKHEINNMIAEQVLPMLYESKYYNHRDLPSIEEIRRKLASDLMVKLY